MIYNLGTGQLTYITWPKAIDLTTNDLKAIDLTTIDLTAIDLTKIDLKAIDLTAIALTHNWPNTQLA